MDRELAVAIILALTSGGFVGGIVAARRVKAERAKLGAESQSIIVDAAQGAVIIQQGVVASLQDQLERARQEIAAHEETFADVDRRLQECEDARDGFLRELRRIEHDTELDQLGREGRIDRRETE